MKPLTKKQIIIAVGAVLVIGAIFFGYQYKKQNHEEFSWSIKVSGCDTDTDACNPKSEVSLLDEGATKTYFSTTYPGNCLEKDELGLKENEITGISCWWVGGGGYNAGVFKEGRKFIFKEKVMDEGNDESSTFNEWIIIKEIKL